VIHRFGGKFESNGALHLQDHPEKPRLWPLPIESTWKSASAYAIHEAAFPSSGLPGSLPETGEDLTVAKSDVAPITPISVTSAEAEEIRAYKAQLFRDFAALFNGDDHAASASRAQPGIQHDIRSLWYGSKSALEQERKRLARLVADGKPLVRRRKNEKVGK
jgi:hypothetical protein